MMNRSTRRMSTVMIEIIIKKSAIMFIRIFSFRGIPLFSTIDSTYFLYTFVFLNQASTLCELLAKQKAANKKKGPPGSTGNTIPKTPIPKQITTGSKLGDMALYRIPKIGKLIKAYNRIEAIGSEVLRLQQARDASCRKKK